MKDFINEKTNISNVTKFYQALSSGSSLPAPSKIGMNDDGDSLIRWSGKGEYSSDRRNAQEAYIALPKVLKEKGFKVSSESSVKTPMSGARKYFTKYEHPNLKDDLMVSMFNDEGNKIYTVDLYYLGDAEELIKNMAIKKESYSWDLTEGRDDPDLSKAFWVIFFSGQIGGPKGKNIYSAKGLKGTISATFDDKTVASQYASSRNKMLSPGEKSYYKMKYSVVPAELKNIIKEEKVNRGSNLYDVLFKDSSVVNPTKTIDRKTLRWVVKTDVDKLVKEIDRALKSKKFNGSGFSKASKDGDTIKRTTQTYFHPEIQAWESVTVLVSKNIETGESQIDVSTLGNPDNIRDAIA